MRLRVARVSGQQLADHGTHSQHTKWAAARSIARRDDATVDLTADGRRLERPPASEHRTAYMYIVLLVATRASYKSAKECLLLVDLPVV